MSVRWRAVLMVVSGVVLTGCSPAPPVQASYDPQALRFSGERAYALEAAFVEEFTYRHTGMPNNAGAVEWLQGHFEGLGLACSVDPWEIVLYSQTVVAQNLVCVLPGESPREIVLMAHHDQSPATVQGADNDGSGVAILLHLAELFAAEGTPRYTLVFVSTDAEEYGMIGSKRFMDTHPDRGRIIAGISHDNLGKYFYDGLDLSPMGQFRNYGPLWLQRASQESARAAGDLWVPVIRGPVDQALNQAVPISFMDEGPMNAAGVPAFGFAGHVPPDFAETHWETYHTPGDTMEVQSAAVLHQSGRVSEALIRQLEAMDEFPGERGPYLYFEGSGRVLRGLPLYLLFVAVVGVMFLLSIRAVRDTKSNPLTAWRRAFPHFAGLWLPLVGSVVLTYLLVAVGLIPDFEAYPALAKDPLLFNPIWPAVLAYLAGLAAFLVLGRRAAARFNEGHYAPTHPDLRSLGFFMIGLAGIYILALNPFSMIFLLPPLAWALLRGRRGAGILLDMVFFLLGGVLIYLLIYFFGFLILRNGLAVLWYLLMMFAIQMVSLLTAVVIMAVIAAGLSMIVPPARRSPSPG